MGCIIISDSSGSSGGSQDLQVSVGGEIVTGLNRQTVALSITSSETALLSIEGSYIIRRIWIQNTKYSNLYRTDVAETQNSNITISKVTLNGVNISDYVCIQPYCYDTTHVSSLGDPFPNVKKHTMIHFDNMKIDGLLQVWGYGTVKGMGIYAYIYMLDA